MTLPATVLTEDAYAKKVEALSASTFEAELQSQLYSYAEALYLKQMERVTATRQRIATIESELAFRSLGKPGRAYMHDIATLTDAKLAAERRRQVELAGKPETERLARAKLVELEREEASRAYLAQGGPYALELRAMSDLELARESLRQTQFLRASVGPPRLRRFECEAQRMLARISDEALRRGL